MGLNWNMAQDPRFISLNKGLASARGLDRQSSRVPSNHLKYAMTSIVSVVSLHTRSPTVAQTSRPIWQIATPRPLDRGKKSSATARRITRVTTSNERIQLSLSRLWHRSHGKSSRQRTKTVLEYSRLRLLCLSCNENQTLSLLWTFRHEAMALNKEQDPATLE